MKRFLIEYKEITYGVVEVFADSEEEARNIAECEGNRIVNDSEMELWQVQKEEDLSTKYKSM